VSLYGEVGLGLSVEVKEYFCGGFRLDLGGIDESNALQYRCVRGLCISVSVTGEGSVKSMYNRREGYLKYPAADGR